MSYREYYICAPWHKKSNLEFLYNEQGLSLVDIAKLYKVCQRTIQNWMKRFNIDRRGFGGTASRFNGKMYKNRHYLKQQYIAVGLSTLEIAVKQGVHKSIIAKWLVKYNIPRRPAHRHKNGAKPCL